jgi:hypothetical protein
VSSSDPEGLAPSHLYYFAFGTGVWHGTFQLSVMSWKNLRGARIGLINTLLVGMLVAVQRLLGPARLDSTITARPDDAFFGVAENIVRLSQMRTTLYLLRERYLLSPDGSAVWVDALEQFGPVPRLRIRRFEYPAEIAAGGLGSTYHMPLLGSEWTATYRFSDDRMELSGVLRCSWAEARESARRALGQ